MTWSSEKANNMSSLDKTLTQKFKSTGGGKKKRSFLGVTFKTVVLSFNIIIVLACTGTLIFQGSQCVVRWLGSETKAILSVKPTGDATFLAFSICPRFEEAYNDTYLGQIGISRDDYKKGNYFGNTKAGNGYDIFEQATYNLYEVMESIRISTANVNESNVYVYFNESIEAYDDIAIFKTVYDETYGRCFSMQITERIKSYGIIDIQFISKMGIHVYLHHPGQYMDVDSKTKTYGNLGNMMFIDLTHELTVNTLEEEGEIPCNANFNFDYDSCINREISRTLMDEFGCVVPYVARNPSNPVCHFDDSDEGKQRQAKVVERYDYLSSNGQRNLCQTPCAMIEVFLGLPFGGVYDDNRAHMKLYIKSTVKKKKTVLDYTWVSMLAEIGGYTGLLLGISVVNITNYLDNAFYRVVRK